MELVAVNTPNTGWEAVVEAGPEVIVILEYQDQPAQQKIDFLKSNPATSTLRAVVNDNFYVLDYNEAVSSPGTSTGSKGSPSSSASTPRTLNRPTVGCRGERWPDGPRKLHAAPHPDDDVPCARAGSSSEHYGRCC